MENLNERKRIGKRIADIRKEKGYTTRELADKCGVHFSNVGKIERGTYNVSIDILSKIADVLGIEISFEARSALKQFVIDNQDRDDLVGDLCKDLIKDNAFLHIKLEEEQRDYILRLPTLHHSITDAVNDFFKEYLEEVVNINEI